MDLHCLVMSPAGVSGFIRNISWLWYLFLIPNWTLDVNPPAALVNICSVYWIMSWIYIVQECRETLALSYLYLTSFLPRGEVGDDVDGALRGEEATTFCLGVWVVEESRGSSSKQSDTVARHMNVKSKGGANPVELSVCSSMFSIQYSSAKQLFTTIHMLIVIIHD